ncbi:Arginine biosynthesis protein ArgJ [Naviculisporaceae sp. PSN 640]
MTREACKYLPGQYQPSPGHEHSSMMVMHTGVGGQRLPTDDILKKIPNLCQEGLGQSHDHWLNAAIGLCTPDTFPKLASRTFTLPCGGHLGPTFSIAGITKGAGMVHPNMATTLGIICTDAPVTPAVLQTALSAAADKSYNSISVDGDTSTNDMVAIFANGAPAPPDMVPIGHEVFDSDTYLVFKRVLEDFMVDMAKLVVRDAEGASKFITIRVRGGPPSDIQDWHGAAKRVASVIARSSLVKTAFYGKDPAVWSGIMAALGYSLLDTPFAGQGLIVPEQTSIGFVNQKTGHVQKVLDKGIPVRVDETIAKGLMRTDDVEVVVDLRDGGASKIEEVIFWTSDLTHDFVTINAGVVN